MAERSLRDRTDAEIARGSAHAPRIATRSPNLASIVARWQQTIGNRGLAQLSAMTESDVDAGAGGAAPTGADGELQEGGARGEREGKDPGAKDGAKDGVKDGAKEGAGRSGEPTASDTTGGPTGATTGDRAGTARTPGATAEAGAPDGTSTLTAGPEPQPTPAAGPEGAQDAALSTELGSAPEPAPSPGVEPSSATPDTAALPPSPGAPELRTSAPGESVIEMPPMYVGRSPDSRTPAEIEMPPEYVGRSPNGHTRAAPDEIEMPPDDVGRPTAGRAAAEIEMPPMYVGRSPDGQQAPAAPDEIEMPPEYVGRPVGGQRTTATPPSDASRQASQLPAARQLAVDERSPGSSPPTGAGQPDARALTKPGFTERNAGLAGTRAPAAKPKPKYAGETPGGEKGGGKRGGKGGGGKAAPKRTPSLGDPTLDKWKAAVAGSTDAVQPGDLGDAKTGPGAVADTGKQASQQRQGAQPDPAADAKAHQPPLPKEEPKQQRLDTSQADAVIAGVEGAGQRRLTDQSFSPAGRPPPYAGATLAPSDYVPKNLSTKADELAQQLAGTLEDESKRAELTKQLEALKAQIASIEEQAGKGAVPDIPTTIQDQGPASLTPPDPAMGDVLGDAIARAMQSITPKAQAIVKGAVTRAKGDKVPKMLEMGTAEQPTLEDELRTELTGIAAAAGVSKEQLDTKIAEQKDLLAKQADENQQQVHQAAATAEVERTEQAKQEGAAIAGAKDAVNAEIEAKTAAAQGPPDTKAIEAKRDELMRKLEQTGASALAGLRGSLTKRHADLDAGASEKKQKIKQATDTQAAAIRRHWSNDPDPNKGMVEARPTADWGITESAKVDGELKRLKEAAQTEHDGFAAGVTGKLGPGKEQLRDWAARQEGRERGFWERLLDMFRDWGNQAKANNEAWERQRNAESRDAMAADLNALTAIRQAQLDRNSEAAQAEFARLGKEQQQLAQQFFAGKIDSIGFVAESTMARISGRRTPELATRFEERAIAEWDWESLGQLARATNPGFQPKVLANKVHGGVDGWGTNEAKVYEGLGGAKTAVERAALDKCYRATFGSSMAEDIRDDMSSEELDRAEALMSGDSAMADAATIAEAVDGLGTNEQAIRDALRGKTPEELEAIKKAYREKYGKELTADLRDDMGGAELDNALALADGDIDKADAAELEDAMSGPGTDEEKMTKVYERIREEENKYALAHGLTKAELDQRIRDRNNRVGAKYAAMGYGDLKANAKDELSDGDPRFGANADNKLFTALQEGDESKIDAAKALVEREGTYTSDDEVEKIVRNQRTKAEFEVNLDEAGQKARLLALAQSGDIPPDEYKAQMALLDPRDEKNKERREAKIQAKGKENMAALKTAYEGIANDESSVALRGHETFDDLVEQGTSGYSKDEINELIDAGGKLSDDREIYYAVAGVGTDEAKIKETLKDKTPAEVQKIREAYERKNGPGSFDADILGDLSGREDLDVGLQLKYGDPSTFARQLDAAKTPEERQRLLANFEDYLTKRRDFEKSGAIGGAMDVFGDGMNSADQLSDAIDRAKKYDAALTHAEQQPGYDPTKKHEDPNLVAAQANFDMNFQGAVQAQEEVREQIDAFTDIAAQVGGAIAGIAVTILTAGTAGPAVIALYAAAASAAASIALKMSLKGAAYGWEDLGVDVAVGLVDGVVSYATAGFGKALVASLEHAVVAQAAKAAAKEGLEEVGESVVKAFIKEAIEEGIENGIQAVPSAFVEGVLNGQDPLAAAKGAGMAGLQGAGMGVGIHGATTMGGAALKSIKSSLQDEPHVDMGGPKGLDEPHAGPGKAADTAPDSTPDLPDAVPDAPPPEVHLPPAADPKAVVDAAEQGKLPDGASGRVDEGKLKENATPEPHRDAPEASAPREQIPMRSAADRVDPEQGRFPDREPAPPREKAAPHPDDVGKQLSNEDLATRYGMPEENVAKIDRICKEEGVIVDIRPTTPYAEPMLRDGKALPKPEKIKAKTINELDVMLGLAPPENLGKVGWFPPEKIKLPDNFDQLDPKLQDALLSRAKQRQAEYHDHVGDMAKLVDQGKVRLEPDGTITNTGLLEGKPELPFTGDHDIFDIRQADGRPLTPERYKEVVEKLIAADAGVMHGAANNWKLDSPQTFTDAAMDPMLKNHSEGGKEPLVRFGAGEPHGTWHEPYEIPEGTIIYSEGPEALDRAANMSHFEQVIAADPHAEYALMRNVETGEYLVMQGNVKEVPVFEAEGMVDAPTQQVVGGPAGELAKGGKWVVEAHSHPVEPGLEHVPEYNRLPSGAKGDMGRMVDEAYRTGQARVSELHYKTPDGPAVTKFGFDPDPANAEPYFVEFPTPEGPVKKTFPTIEAYHGWYKTQHGDIADLGAVPESFRGPRFRPPEPAPHVGPDADVHAGARDPDTDFDEEPPTNPGRPIPDRSSVRGVEREPWDGTLSEQVDAEFREHQLRAHADAQAELAESVTPPTTPDDLMALPEVRQAIADARALESRLPSKEDGKTVACSLNGEPVESGWSDRGSYTGKAETTDRVGQTGIDAGHDTTGHTFDRDTPGRYENSHAERQAAEKIPGDPIAVDRPMCPDCQRWFRDFAKLHRVIQVVRDPERTRIFLPDGSVRVRA